MPLAVKDSITSLNGDIAAMNLDASPQSGKDAVANLEAQVNGT